MRVPGYVDINFILGALYVHSFDINKIRIALARPHTHTHAHTARSKDHEGHTSAQFWRSRSPPV